MKIQKFEDLEIWKKSIELATNIYNLTNESEFNKDFALREQIRRSVISISSNIVEGYERSNNNEFIRFLNIAKGSCGECRCQLYIAFNVGYIPEDVFEYNNNKLKELSKQIYSLIKYLDDFRKKQS